MFVKRFRHPPDSRALESVHRELQGAVMILPERLDWRRPHCPGNFGVYLIGQMTRR